MNSFFKKQVRRTVRNLLILNLIIGGISAFIISKKYGNFQNDFFGPFSVQLSTEIGEEIPAKYFVEITTEETYDPDVEAEIETTVTEYRFRYRKFGQDSSSRVSAKYIIGYIGDTSVLIETFPGFEVPIDNTGITVEGILRPFPGDIANFPGFANFLIDTTAKPNSNAKWIVLVCGLLLLLSLVNIFKGLLRLASYKQHPAFKRLNKNGKGSTAQQVMDKEMGQDGGFAKVESIYITNSYIIDAGLFIIDIYPINDIFWVYGEKIHDKGGVNKPISWYSKTLEMKLKNVEDPVSIMFDDVVNAARAAQAILKRKPNILYSYSDEIEFLYREDSKTFISLIDNSENNKEIMEKLTNDHSITKFYPVKDLKEKDKSDDALGELMGYVKWFT